MMDGTDIAIADLYFLLQSDDEELKKKLHAIDKVILCGWVRSNRDSGSIGFISFNDGTCFQNAQLVYHRDKIRDASLASHLKTGMAIRLIGDLRLTPDARQPFEIDLDDVEILGDVDETYPLQKKHHTVEFLREIAHLRPRSNLFSAVFRIRNALSMALHEFFQSEGFMYVHTPIITGNDAEGAGQTFSVVTNGKDPNAFFGRPAVLTVTGQLHVETFAMAYRNVYTFGPTFRAEHSNTLRHASEFWMVEPEIAFADLHDCMDLIERCLKHCIDAVLDSCQPEMAFLDRFIAAGLIERLKAVAAAEFHKMTYTDGIEELKNAVKHGHKFEHADITWGMDLLSEHERYLTEEVAKGPLFLTDFPSGMKAFYMRENDDGKTVAACDLLVPHVGELVGGSQREERYEILKKKMEKAGNLKELAWYLDTRRYGGCQHAGFGIGFDRLLMYLTGVNNIRDVQPFPRTSDPLKY